MNSAEPDITESSTAATGFAAAPVTQRMSLLAIAALIVGILAFFTCVVGYVLGIVGNLLAVFALLSIQRSNGRLRGKGAAMTAIALNSIAFLFGIVVALGAVGLVRDAIRYSGSITSLQSKDVDGFRATIATSASEKLTPERVAEFRLKLDEQVGALKGVPQKDIVEFWRRISDGVERQSAAMDNLPRADLTSLFVLPADFEKGRGLVIVYVDSAEKSPQCSLGKIRNLGVVREGARDVIWLFPLTDGATTAPTVPGPASVPPPAP